MDYEVFLLSSVREAFMRTGDSRGSVVDGLASTARVITSAALIMVAVFLGFAFDPSVIIKMIGVGMAAAIAIDATLIRLIVVPAAMALLGRASWYLPPWLNRVLPTLDPHSSHLPSRESEGTATGGMSTQRARPAGLARWCAVPTRSGPSRGASGRE